MIKKIAYIQIVFFVSVALLSSILPGCSVKKTNLVASYLDSTNTVKLDKYPFKYNEPTIQPYEFVEVRFAGLNPTVTSTLNSYGGANLNAQIAGKDGNVSGQQVDKEGNLNFPLIGKIRAEGLTTDSLRAELLKKVEPILKDPYIYIGLPRRGVTFMGEVRSSATYVFAKERPNILEFLAQAGSVTDLADITKVKVYRENSDGKRILGNVNLNDSTLFNSPFFYPIPNDVVYVPSSKKKALQGATTYFPYVSLFISLLTISLTYLFRR